MAEKKVANVIILDDDDQFLIIKRTKTAPTHPLHWDLPGGHVEEGESFEEAAKREALEETNLEVSDLKPAKVPNPFRNFFITKKYSGNIEFKENPESGFVEHSDHKWVTLEKYKKMEDLSIKPEDIEKAMENLSKKSLYEQKYQERLELLLMEGRKENVFKKYASLPKDNLEALARNDEEHNYKHLGWMAKQLAAVPDLDRYHIIAQEAEAEKIIDAVDKFLEFRPRLKNKDLNQYKNIEHIDMAIHTDVIMPRIAKSKKERGEDPQTTEFTASGEGTVIYEDDRYFVVRPDTLEASCFFGKKTSWCIAQPGNSYFDDYTSNEQKVFYFIKDDGLRADDDFRQMAVQVGPGPTFEMFWDRHDEPYEEPTQDWEEFAEHLHSESGMALGVAEKIMEEIYDHAEDNPPVQNSFHELFKRVDENNEFDTKWISFFTNFDEYNAGVVTPAGDVRIAVNLDEEVEALLNNNFIDWEGDDTNLREIFVERLEEAMSGRIEEGYQDYKTGEELEYPKDIEEDLWNEIGIDHNSYVDMGSLEMTVITDTLYISFSVAERGSWGHPRSFTDADDAESTIQYLSNIFSEDAEYSGLMSVIYQLLPEIITGGKAMSDIIEQFDKMVEASKKSDKVSIKVYEVDQYNRDATMISLFDLPVPADYRDFGSNYGEIPMQDQLETIIRGSLEEIWQRAHRTAKNQLQLQFGSEYSEKEMAVEMPGVKLKYITGPRASGIVRVWLKVEIKFMDSPEEMSTAYSFFKFVAGYYDKLAMTFTREFNREIEIMKKRMGQVVGHNTVNIGGDEEEVVITDDDIVSEAIEIDLTKSIKKDFDKIADFTTVPPAMGMALASSDPALEKMYIQYLQDQKPRIDAAVPGMIETLEKFKQMYGNPKHPNHYLIQQMSDTLSKFATAQAGIESALSSRKHS